MQQKIVRAHSVGGSVRVPGDKSISHRYAMLASVAEGVSRIHNYSTGADCQSTLGCMRGLGVNIACKDDAVEIHGRGLDGLKEPAAALDAGNSGSTIRMLSGILAGQPFRSHVAGDESLSRRPMERIMRPLRRMGASFVGRAGGKLPIAVTGTDTPLPIVETLKVASAQLKSAILFCGLTSPGAT
ncbi:MAG: 3-phosphoshikimate 1-carboxyvinyltransferase, partial [Bryobacteraceae bacterium]